ncbi:hypothetical protein FQ707_04575 [Bacteroidaceae bacterium HV4-6-C5C]|nr:hypothetical protein FQ707_04575 [Bacteroidaceae bacterium HV4-6-C5C]
MNSFYVFLRMKDFERWIYILKNMETLKRMPFKARKSVFEKLEKIVDIASLSKEEREKYDESIKVYRDNLAVMAYAKEKERKEAERGRAEGLEKGPAEGRAEGRAEGLEKGRAEGTKRAQIDIARKLKDRGCAVEEIADITGLTLNELKEI